MFELQSSRLVITGIFILQLTTQIMAGQAPMTIPATRTGTPPKIDGILNESIWQTLPVLDNFYGFYPHNDRPGSRQTEARVAYDDDALYVAAICYDEPDSIARA